MSYFDWTAYKTYDWHSFCAMVEKRPTAFAWQEGSQLNYGDRWNGTDSFEDNVSLLRRGWPEGVARLVAGIEALSAMQDDVQPAWAMDAVGAFPDVGAYLAGDIEHMHNPDVEQPAAPVLRLCLNGSVSALVRPWQIENFGIALLTMIDSLERAGHQIELVWQAVLAQVKPLRRGSKKLVLSGLPPCGVEVALKHAGEHMDLDRLAYALAHPAMLRRSVFAVIEQHPRFSCLGDSFGTPRDYPAAAREPDSLYLPRLCTETYNLNTPATALASLQRIVSI